MSDTGKPAHNEAFMRYVARLETKADKIIKQRNDLLEALKAINKWMVQNTKASNRPASLDKQIMDVLAKAEKS